MTPPEPPQAAPLPPDEEKPVRRTRRLGLYGPLAALAVLSALWSVGWFVMRARTISSLNAWAAGEAARGQTWACQDRKVGGFPFRIELTCTSLVLERPGTTLFFGRVVVVSQIYAPGHLIAEASGPFGVRSGFGTADATWSVLQASVVLGRNGFERLAVAAEQPTVRYEDAARALELRASRIEFHLRPDPALASAYDIAVSAKGAALPQADALMGGTEPVDIEIVSTVTDARELPARAVAAEMERWRAAGGRMEIGRLAIVKGARRIEGTGRFTIDDLHRPSGQIDLAAVGLEGLLGRLLGDRSGLAGGLLGALLGGGTRRDPPPPSGTPGLNPLPPIRIDGGRLLLGPFAVPGLRIDPLY